ncbi:MAG: PIN domain-containing protein [Candidatus Aenigmatarchaeota archaeon]
MIFVDSNIIIFSEMTEYPEHKIAVEKLSHTSQSGIFINDIIISEVFHKIFKLIGHDTAVKRVKNILSSKSFIYVPIEKETFEKAVELTKYVRINDAIIAQQVIDLKSSLLTDNVKDFRKIKGLKIIKLR